jgi:hypothetical protein
MLTQYLKRCAKVAILKTKPGNRRDLYDLSEYLAETKCVSLFHVLILLELDESLPIWHANDRLIEIVDDAIIELRDELKY